MFICTTEEALISALSYDGFKNQSVLVQEYENHQEQVYKVYALGPNWHGIEIRHSVPERLINNSAGKGFQFDSQVKFNKSDFTLFTNFSRVNNELMTEFIAAFSAEFNLMLFGIDIVITNEGKHQIIDCNYFSSYTEFD